MGGFTGMGIVNKTSVLFYSFQMQFVIRLLKILTSMNQAELGLVWDCCWIGCLCCFKRNMDLYNGAFGR